MSQMSSLQDYLFNSQNLPQYNQNAKSAQSAQSHQPCLLITLIRCLSDHKFLKLFFAVLFWTAKKSFCVKLYVYCCHMGSIWSIQFHQNECHNHFGPNSKVFSQAMTRSRMKGAKCIKDSFESQSDQLSATGLTCHRQSIISSFKIASEKLNHLSLSWCTFLITLPRLRSAFYIKKSFSNIARGTTDPG